MAAASPGEESPAQSPTIQRRLLQRLTGARDDDGEAASERDPLRVQTTAQTNRERFERNQRYLAMHVLSLAPCGMICGLILALFLMGAYLALYINGWLVFIYHSEKPCDQPLKWWLLAMLLMPLIQWGANAIFGRNAQSIILGILAGLGVSLWWQCKTCQETNPELYNFVKLYMIVLFSMYAVFLFILFGVVALVLWFHANGLLEAGSQPATPGLINDIRTVPYDPEVFSNSADDDRQPPECSVCQCEFDADKTIKLTSCGHYFHGECLGRWLEKYAKSCPLCRTDLDEAMKHKKGGSSSDRDTQVSFVEGEP